MIGPFALPRENKLYVTFSGAAVDTSYVVGLLSIEKGKDLLQPENRKQGNYPILTARSVMELELVWLLPVPFLNCRTEL